MVPNPGGTTTDCCRRAGRYKKGEQCVEFFWFVQRRTREKRYRRQPNKDADQRGGHKVVGQEEGSRVVVDEDENEDEDEDEDGIFEHTCVKSSITLPKRREVGNGPLTFLIAVM